METLEQRAIAKNYFYVIVGCVVFPLMIVAFVSANKKRSTSSEWEYSHWKMQRITLIAFLAIMGALSAVILGMIIFGAGNDHLGSSSLKASIATASNLSFAVFAWVVLRSARGLYLAGAKGTISNAGSLWFWPRSSR